jgi:hypothetical protein
MGFFQWVDVFRKPRAMNPGIALENRPRLKNWPLSCPGGSLRFLKFHKLRKTVQNELG